MYLLTEKNLKDTQWCTRRKYMKAAKDLRGPKLFLKIYMPGFFCTLVQIQTFHLFILDFFFSIPALSTETIK